MTILQQLAHFRTVQMVESCQSHYVAVWTALKLLEWENGFSTIGLAGFEAVQS